LDEIISIEFFFWWIGIFLVIWILFLNFIISSIIIDICIIDKIDIVHLIDIKSISLSRMLWLNHTNYGSTCSWWITRYLLLLLSKLSGLLCLCLDIWEQIFFSLWYTIAFTFILALIMIILDWLIRLLLFICKWLIVSFSSLCLKKNKIK
jgi:hypothetical protein